VKITEVRVKLMGDRSDKLLAFCSITLEGEMVVRDLKIIGGAKGLFVAMPSRKLTDRCGRCGGRNHLRASFCNDCGAKLGGDRAPKDPTGRAKLHVDVAHPINAASREFVQGAVLRAYQEEVDRSRQPGYVAPRFEEEDDGFVDFEQTPAKGLPAIPGDVASPAALRAAAASLPPASPPPPQPQPQPQPQPVGKAPRSAPQPGARPPRPNSQPVKPAPPGGQGGDPSPPLPGARPPRAVGEPPPDDNFSAGLFT